MRTVLALQMPLKANERIQLAADERHPMTKTAETYIASVIVTGVAATAIAALNPAPPPPIKRTSVEEMSSIFGRS